MVDQPLGQGPNYRTYLIPTDVFSIADIAADGSGGTGGPVQVSNLIYKQATGYFYANNRVGIGTATPDRTLDVNGLARFQEKVTINGVSGGFHGLEFIKDGLSDATHVRWEFSHRSSNMDLFLFGYNGTIFKDFMRHLYATDETQTRNLRPQLDNQYGLGSGALRWDTVFSVTPTINTSDEREKQWLRTGLSDAEYGASLEIADKFGWYQWHEAIAKKGEDNARIHFGIGAQTLWRIMAKWGLIDPIDQNGRPGKTPYAFLCWDEWDEEREPILKTVKKKVKQEQPNPKFNPKNKASSRNKKTIMVSVEVEEQVDTGKTRVKIKAGDGYGYRPDMLNAFMACARHRYLDEELLKRDRRQDEIEERLQALEAA